jgi:hypothetical protein
MSLTQGEEIAEPYAQLHFDETRRALYSRGKTQA